MRHIDLFSGIGGFALAARNVWGDEHEVVTFCEINKYAQQVLKKHWPDAPICEDIRKLNYEFIANANGIGRVHKQSQEQSAVGHIQTQRELEPGFESSVLPTIDLLTGGFPCQPFSNAGRKRGKDDDRFLWPEMLRVIKEFKPRWIVGENVGGLINMAQPDGEPEMGGETDTQEGGDNTTDADGLLFGIIDSIEQAGYSVQAFVIPACAVGAPHRRDRIWIVAHSTSDGCDLRECDREERHVHDTTQWEITEDKRERDGRVNRAGEAHDADANARPQLREQRNIEGMEANTSKRSTCAVHDKRCGEDATHTIGERLEGCREFSRSDSPVCDRRKDWEQNWIEVATEFCGMDDGLPVRLDGFELSKSAHRVERLKALGNAIVPQVVEEIFKAIKEVEIVGGCK